MKRNCAIILALALCLSLSAPAFAAEISPVSPPISAPVERHTDRLWQYVSDDVLEDVYQDLTQRLRQEYGDLYTLEHFTYEVETVRENEDSIDADLILTADMTLTRKPSAMPHIRALTAQAETLPDPEQKTLARQEVRRMTEDLEREYYQKPDPSAFLYTARFSKADPEAEAQLFYRDGAAEGPVTLTPVPTASSRPVPSVGTLQTAAAAYLHTLTRPQEAEVSRPVYNRLLARNYAREHATDVPEFSKANGQGSDCANFVSKTLHAGGFPYDRPGRWHPSTDGTIATCGVNWMRTGYYQNGGVVPYMTEKNYFYYQPQKNLVQVGAIMYWNRTSHVALVTYSDGVTLKYSQHSNRPLAESAAVNVVHRTEDASFYMPNPETVTIQGEETAYPAVLTIRGTLPTLRYESTSENSYDLSKLPVTAVDQYGDPVTLDPSLYRWSLSEGTAAVVEGNRITGHTEGEDVLTLSYPTGQAAESGIPAYITSAPIPVKVHKQPVLKSLTVSGPETFTLWQGESAVLADHFTVTGADQYGEPMAADPVWHSSDPAIFSVENGVLTAHQNKGTADLYAVQVNPQGETIVSNTIALSIELPFVDVDDTAYYMDAVHWAVSNGITTGTTPTKFAPEAVCTRGQAVTFLWRAAGCPTPQEDAMPLQDVAPAEYCYVPVQWALERGITTGMTSSRFGPNETCTRAQIAAFLWRAAGAPVTETENPFIDVSEQGYYKDAVLWAVSKGITTGTTPTKFAPDAGCTRAQIVTFLYRNGYNPSVS